MEEGDLILCKVEKVSNTVTLVRLPNGQSGTIVSSEIAPGRIKLMRQYVVPNKQIVCKVLRVNANQIQLSLRRVNSKEKKEVMHTFKQSQAIDIAFRQILGDDEPIIRKKILDDFTDLVEFITMAKNDDSLILKYIPEDKRCAIRKISERKRGNQELKQNVKVKCVACDGVNKIKGIFDFDNKNLSVTYISAGNFKLKLAVEDFKSGKKELAEIIKEIEKRAKKDNCELYIKDEK